MTFILQLINMEDQQETLTVHKVLSDIQKRLETPKNIENEYGGFKFRNAENILNEVKSHLPDGFYVTCSDDKPFELLGYIFVTATACISDGSETIWATMSTPIDFEKNTKNGNSQHGGSASSYARKYALQGLFAISDPGDDPDSKDNRVTTANKVEKPWLNGVSITKAVDAIKTGSATIEDAKAKYRISKDNMEILEAAEREFKMDNQFEQTV
jgi:hypothetical protein